MPSNTAHILLYKKVLLC